MKTIEIDGAILQGKVVQSAKDKLNDGISQGKKASEVKCDINDDEYLGRRLAYLIPSPKDKDYDEARQDRHDKIQSHAVVRGISRPIGTGEYQCKMPDDFVDKSDKDRAKDKSKYLKKAGWNACL